MLHFPYDDPRQEVFVQELNDMIWTALPNVVKYARRWPAHVVLCECLPGQQESAIIFLSPQQILSSSDEFLCYLLRHNIISSHASNCTFIFHTWVDGRGLFTVINDIALTDEVYFERYWIEHRH